MKQNFSNKQQNRTKYSARSFLRHQRTVVAFVIHCNVIDICSIFLNVVHVMFRNFFFVKGQKN